MRFFGSIDPTRPVAPAFTKMTAGVEINPHAPVASKRKAGSGGLIRTAAMAVGLQRARQGQR